MQGRDIPQTASGGVSGTFTGATRNLAFLTPVLIGALQAFDALGGGWWNRVEPPKEKVLNVGTGQSFQLIDKNVLCCDVTSDFIESLSNRGVS